MHYPRSTTALRCRRITRPILISLASRRRLTCRRTRPRAYATCVRPSTTAAAAGAAYVARWTSLHVRRLQKSIKEAHSFGNITVAYSSEDTVFNRVPEQSEYDITEDAEYLYLVSNNTIYGTQFQSFPDVDTMLVSDMSSDIVSRSIDVSRFGLIFAGAQKNLGPAGVTIVIIREDLVDRCPDHIPTMLKYSTHVDKGSMFNTPPVFPI